MAEPSKFDLLQEWSAAFTAWYDARERYVGLVTEYENRVPGGPDLRTVKAAERTWRREEVKETRAAVEYVRRYCRGSGEAGGVDALDDDPHDIYESLVTWKRLDCEGYCLWASDKTICPGLASGTNAPALLGRLGQRVPNCMSGEGNRL